MSAAIIAMPGAHLSREHRAGASNVLAFLRDLEARALNLAHLDPAALRARLIALGGLHRGEARAFLHVLAVYLSLAIVGQAPDLDSWDVVAELASMEG